MCYNIFIKILIGGNIILKIIRHTIKNEKLVPWVKFIWQISSAEISLYYKLLPTDCIDIIINLGSDMVYETEEQTFTAPRFHINALRSRYSYIRQETPTPVFGISLYPYGLYPFVHKSIKGLHNSIIDLYDLAPNLAQKLAGSINPKLPPDIYNGIEQALLSELMVNKDYIQKAQLIYGFLTEDPPVAVQTYCEKHSLNIKTFERILLSYTGFTPKALQAIRRFQITGNQLAHGAQTNLAEIALDNHFTDQAHFTKDFRRFSGTAPATFLTQKISVKENAAYTYR